MSTRGLTVAEEEPYDQDNDRARVAAPWGWWITLGVVGTLSIYHFAEIWYKRRLLRRAPQTRAARAARGTRPRRYNLLASASTILRRECSVRRLSIPLYGHPTVVELAWTVAYIVIFVSLTFYQAHKDGRWNWEDAMGYMVFAQFPLIVGLAGKNNVISYATGISYDRLNFLHRTAGRMAVLWAWIHAIGRLKLGLVAPHNFGSSYIAGAISALTAMTIIEFTAESPIRKRYYEVFIVTHLLFVVMMVVGAWVHHPEVAHWIQAGLALWCLDRIASVCRFVWNNQVWRRDLPRGTVELLSGDVIRVTVRGKKIWWAPGHHVFLSCQALGGMSLERHPFSILSLPKEGASEQEMTFLCRAKNGFTKRMRNAVTGSIQEGVPIHVEGPYGIPVSLETFDTVVLLAGGIGITYAMSHFLGVIRSIRSGRSLTRRLRLVWCTKTYEDIDWISSLLEAAFEEPLPEGLEVEVDIHITQSSKSDDPNQSDASREPIEASEKDATERGLPLASRTLEPLSRANLGKPPVRIMVDAEGPAEAPVFKNPFPNKETPDAEVAPVAPAPPPRVSKPSSIASDVTYVIPLRPGQLATCLAPYAHVRRVRVALGDVIWNGIDGAQGPIHVGICGPASLANVVRGAMADRMCPFKVFRGEQFTVDFHCEEPGW